MRTVWLRTAPAQSPAQFYSLRSVVILVTARAIVLTAEVIVVTARAIAVTAEAIVVTAEAIAVTANLTIDNCRQR